MITLVINIISLVYVLLISFIFFCKKRFKSIETDLYARMIILTIFGGFVELGSGILFMCNMSDSFTYSLLAKALFGYFILLDMYIYIYSYIITIEKHNQRRINSLYILSFLFFAVVFLLPFETKTNGDNVYSTGPVMNYIFALTCIIIPMILYRIGIGIKQKKYKQLMPLFFFVMFGIIMYLIQLFTNITIISAVFDFVLILMYFTIENPDMKLLKEVNEAKIISDNANEEKTLFLYNMTQEIRETTKNIDNESDIIIDSDSLELDKESARNIKGETSKFRMMTNDILDVSAIDSSSIKIYNSTYNLKLLLKSLIGSYTEVCKNKLIEFRPNIEHDIPDMLYGDNISLKKVINSLLTYSVKNTSRGYVELNINTIKKNDICRLIISIEDSSNGIKSDELEKIKLENKNINEAYKMITVMNGTMMLTSNYGIGTKIKIILDQKMDMPNNSESKKYNEIYNNKKILVIDDSESGIKIIDKLLKGSNIIIDSVLNGRDAIAKIKTKNRYDLILLDEELSQISGLELLKKLESIRNFNIPVILLSKDNKYEYNEEYLKMGFSDILIKPLKKEILLEKIDKFIQRNEI